MPRSFVVLALLFSIGGGPPPLRAQQSAALSHQMTSALVSASNYLHDEMSKGQWVGRVEFDSRSLARLLSDSAAAARVQISQTLGIPFADESRLDTCKPARSVACQLGQARAVLDVRSVTVNGTHCTVELRKYERRSSQALGESLASSILRFTLLLANGGWLVTKYAVVNG